MNPPPKVDPAEAGAGPPDGGGMADGYAGGYGRGSAPPSPPPRDRDWRSSSTSAAAATPTVVAEPHPDDSVGGVGISAGVSPPPTASARRRDPAVALAAAPPPPASTNAESSNDEICTLAATSASAFTAVSSPPNANSVAGNLSSSSESEHLPATKPMSAITAAANVTSQSAPPLSSSNKNASIDDGGIDRSPARLRSTKSATTQWKAPSHSCISRPSSLSSKSRGSQGSNSAKPHAYFASSEEESEAELDEKDSHSSSRDLASRAGYGHQQRHVGGGRGGGGIGMGGSTSFTGSKSSLRGSKRLAKIASQVGSGPHHLHSSRVRMTIPAEHKERGSGRGMGHNGKPVIAYPDSARGGAVLAVPPPPQTVTVAVGKGSTLAAAAAAAPGPTDLLARPSPGGHPLPGGGVPSSTVPAHGGGGPRSPSAIASAELGGVGGLSLGVGLPTRKRLRKKKRRSQKHLPRGLPVFKDSRSCMWTSTYDANAPSEDRYSSLVNVLLRPPKTPRKLRGGAKDGDGVGAGGANASNNCGGEAVKSQSGSSCDGSSVEEENATEAATQKTAHKGDGGASKAPPSPSTNNGDDDEDNNNSLIRLSLWSVIDGHGGGCVATYAAEVLLPHIAASVARALKSEIVDRGVCNVNGQLRDANALDLDGLIRSSDRNRHVGKSQVRQREAGIDVVNPNSIHYRSPYEDSESEGDVGVEDHASRGTQSHDARLPRRRVDPACVASASSSVGSDRHDPGMRIESESEAESEAPVSVASSLLPGNPITHGESVSSLKTSVKTAVSPVTQHAPVGTHSPAEVASITRAITDSFLAVDEGWINSIDPVTTNQTSCISNGRWNAGACALVVFIIQRLDWCRSSRVDHETHHRERGARGFEDTSHNKDAARRRKLDYATKSKSVSSLSTLSSTSSITTEANATETLGTDDGGNSEITETEDDDDVSDIFGPRRRRRKMPHHHHHGIDDDPHHREGVFIATPAGCKGHFYKPHDAMLYTAHVGDCRAVMLGSAPPRTIKVPPEGDSSLSLDHAGDTSEDESSSESIADEISSIEHDSDSSGDLMEDGDHHLMRTAAEAAAASSNAVVPGGRRGGGGVIAAVPVLQSSAVPHSAGMLGYVRRSASKRQRCSAKASILEQPFVPLPPLHGRRDSSSEESAVESDDSMSTTAQEHLPPVGSIVRTSGRVGMGVDASLASVHGAVALDTVDSHGAPAFADGLEEEKLLETEDEEAEEDEIKEVRSVRSGSPTQMDRPPSDRPPSPTQLVADPVHPPPLPLSMLTRPIDLTTDHSAYNPAEVVAVLRRCNNAPRAISSASSGGIKRVAGSLAVTRALGDAYLKTPRLSFFPYKRHAPYITARPEVNCRILTKGADRILILASDGVWERASGDDVLRWVRNYYNARIAGVKEQHLGAVYEDPTSVMMDNEAGAAGAAVGMDDHGRDHPFMKKPEKGMATHSKHGGSRLHTRGQGEVLGGNASDSALGSLHEDSSGGISSGTAAEKAKDLTLPTESTLETPSEETVAAASTLSATRDGEEKLEDSDAATISEATAGTGATTTADETTTTSVVATVGAKRKHPGDPATTLDDAASSRSTSTNGSSHGVVDVVRHGDHSGAMDVARCPLTRRSCSSRRVARHHHHHHHVLGRPSMGRPYSLAIPTVSEVIVRKVLNKVRKTRNISSLRMLMSLPKGRARRSKHDDITATVVDLSGFVS